MQVNKEQYINETFGLKKELAHFASTSLLPSAGQILGVFYSFTNPSFNLLNRKKITLTHRAQKIR